MNILFSHWSHSPPSPVRDSQCKALRAAAQIHSPSKYGKKPESDVNICHHQPDSCTDIPVQFYHKVFANFLELWRNQDDYGITEEKKNILELASSLSTPLKDEEKHAQIFRNWLTYNDLESYIYKTPKIESDGTHFGCYNQQCFLLVNTEVKTDYGTTCRAYHQSTATTLRLPMNWFIKIGIRSFHRLRHVFHPPYWF